MKKLFYLFLIISYNLLNSCNGNTSGDKTKTDSSNSGLEGTRYDASQLSNATIDTSSGQKSKSTAKDSSAIKEDTSTK